MTDNLKNYGIEDDGPCKRRSKRQGRKPYAIQCRLVRPYKHSVLKRLGLDKWWTHGRYATEARREEAYTALVRKAVNERYPWSKMEYRKI